jgi:nifR3 family TIM-barrel protein
VKIGTVDFGNHPVFLAPMEEISDAPFRRLCKRFDADMVYTEFIASEALRRDVEKSKRKMEFDEIERPIGIQIFGNEEQAMVEAALVAQTANPDVIDINWGCPVRKVASKGSGSGILNNIPKMIAITKAVVNSVNIPVTVKTRLGYDNSDKPIVDIALRLQDIGIAALTIHGRTRPQMYMGEADWTLIGEVKNNPNIHIPIIGNGDITSPEIAKKRFEETGVDAIMVGRAATGNPWIFREIKHYLNTGELLSRPTLLERANICTEHLLTSIEWKGERAGIVEMRRQYSHYFSGLYGFKPFKLKLLTSYSLSEILETIELIKESYREME